MSFLSSSSETLPGFSFLKPILHHFVFSDAHAMKREFLKQNQCELVIGLMSTCFHSSPNCCYLIFLIIFVCADVYVQK